MNCRLCLLSFFLGQTILACRPPAQSDAMEVLRKKNDKAAVNYSDGAQIAFYDPQDVIQTSDSVKIVQLLGGFAVEIRHLCAGVMDTNGLKKTGQPDVFIIYSSSNCSVGDNPAPGTFLGFRLAQNLSLDVAKPVTFQMTSHTKPVGNLVPTSLGLTFGGFCTNEFTQNCDVIFTTKSKLFEIRVRGL